MLHNVTCWLNLHFSWVSAHVLLFGTSFFSRFVVSILVGWRSNRWIPSPGLEKYAHAGTSEHVVQLWQLWPWKVWESDDSSISRVGFLYIQPLMDWGFRNILQTNLWVKIQKITFFPQEKSPLNPSWITLVSPSKKAHKSSHQVPCPVCFLSKPRPPWTPFSEFSASIAMTNSASGSFLTLELFNIVQPWGSRKRRCNRNLTIGTMLWK